MPKARERPAATANDALPSPSLLCTEPMTGGTKNSASKRMREAHQAAAHTKWLKTEIQEAIDDPRPNAAHDDVMRRMDERIAAIKARKAGNVPA